MRSLTSRSSLLRRLAALSQSCPQPIAPSNSISTGQKPGLVTPSSSSGYGAFASGQQVREFQSEVEIASRASSSSQESPAAVAGEYAIRNEPRNDWTREEIQAIYESPLMDLLLYGVRNAMLI